MPTGYCNDGSPHPGWFKKGRKPSEEEVQKIWSKLPNGTFYGRKHTEATKALIGQKARDRKTPPSPNFTNRGRKFTTEHRMKLRDAMRRFFGPEKLSTDKRKGVEYRMWRTAVFERDRYTCVRCGDHNYSGRGSTVRLEAHHVKSFATHPELVYDISNGETLCRACHLKTDTIGRPKAEHGTPRSAASGATRSKRLPCEELPLFDGLSSVIVVN